MIGVTGNQRGARKPTWTELVKIEPRLGALLREVRNIRDPGGDCFCANAVWYGYAGWPGIKSRLCMLVGWDVVNDWDRIISSPDAYDVAYDKIYDALPNCRDCDFCFRASSPPASSKAQTARSTRVPATLEQHIRKIRRDFQRHADIIRAFVLDRDNERCVYCTSAENLQVDHIVPVTKWGTNDPSNLQTLCGSCNARKGNRHDG